MGYDLRSNPDPSDLRGRVWFVVDGRDPRHGHPARSLFEPSRADIAAHGGDATAAAVGICQRNGLCGDLYEITASELAGWLRWCDGFVPGNLMVPRPAGGRLLGTLHVREDPSPKALVLP